MSNQKPVFKQLIQIPGPNPIITTGDKDTWDEHVIECCNVFKDENTYYLYYHGIPKNKDIWSRLTYRIGVATSSHPVGPWKKYEKNPIIDLGPEGSWEDRHVACAAVLKEKADKYYMWYSGTKEGQGSRWDVGLATASSPLGPWKKYEGNPILEDFGYIGGVVKVEGKYYMYNEYPIGASSPDQGPICLGTAEKPEGPWTKYEGNPVIPAGDWGAWDDGGYSEAGVVHRDGVFHIFYGGTKWEKLETIGYAYSFDGYNFTKYPHNPVALREKNPDASAFAEVHALYEPPLIYLYHTLRYISSGEAFIEDIGVQILATEIPFRLAMPVLNIHHLDAGMSSSLNSCPPISLEHISNLALTSECTYDNWAKAGMRIHLRASYDGINYDTKDLYAFDNSFEAGNTLSKTVELSPKVMFIKVLVENLSNAWPINNVRITATLGH